jgi:CDGSH-type Zn-finger protein
VRSSDERRGAGSPQEHAAAPGAAPGVGPGGEPGEEPRAYRGGPARRPARRIRLERNGPLLVEGPVEVTGDDGVTVRSDRFAVAVCTCRRSRTYPWCDTSHRRTGRARDGQHGPDTACGRDDGSPDRAGTACGRDDGSPDGAGRRERDRGHGGGREDGREERE